MKNFDLKYSRLIYCVNIKENNVILKLLFLLDFFVMWFEGKFRIGNCREIISCVLILGFIK